MEIETLVEAGSDGGSFMGWFARGHHDRFQFHHEVCHGYDIHTDDRRWFQPDDVKHEWWRTVPMADDEPGHFRYHPAEPGSRGAFEVTVIDVLKMRLQREVKRNKIWEDQGFRAGVNFSLGWLGREGHEPLAMRLRDAAHEHLAAQKTDVR